MTASLAGLRVAVYARFSSDRQRETSIEDQVARARRWAEDRGGLVDDERVFADFAVSGASMARPGVRLLEQTLAARPRLVDVLLVEGLSRISRDSADLQPFLRRVQHTGVRIVAVDGSYDSAAGETTAQTMSHVGGLVSTLYRVGLRDMTIRGMEARARAGKSTGAVPLGYRNVPEPDGRKRIEIDEPRAEVVRRIFAMYAEGHSQATIASTLTRDGVPPPRARRGPAWIHTAVRAILRNERYRGRWAWGAREWRIDPVDGRRRPRRRDLGPRHVEERPDLVIVDAALWAAVQTRADAAAGLWRNAGPKPTAPIARRATHLLSGLLTCECGATIEVWGKGTHDAYLRCAAARRGSCSQRRSFRQSMAVAALLEAVRASTMTPRTVAYMRAAAERAIAEATAAATADVDRLRARELQIVAASRRLAGAIADGAGYETVRAELDAREHELREVRAAMERARATSTALDLPTVDELVEGGQDWGRNVTENPSRAREGLRSALEGGTLRVRWTDAGARLTGQWSPFALLLAVPTHERPTQERAGRSRTVVAGADFVGFRTMCERLGGLFMQPIDVLAA